MGSYFCVVFDKDALDKAINERYAQGFGENSVRNKEDFVMFLKRLEICEFKNHLVYIFESFRDTGIENKLCNEALAIAAKIEDESDKIIMQNSCNPG